MSSSVIRTTPEEREKAFILYARGRELLETARLAFQGEAWCAVGLSAVLGTLSLTEAILVQERGQRCSLAHRGKTGDLLSRELGHLAGVEEAHADLQGLLSEKDRIEDSLAVLSVGDVTRWMEAFERLAGWAARHWRRTE